MVVEDLGIESNDLVSYLGSATCWPCDLGQVDQSFKCHFPQWKNWVNSMILQGFLVNISAVKK